ncbi:MAG TPA: hypothetical protein PLW01_04590, partial [Agitococcus sp.]|nr:hypothetical protein [Agitococcus sp.]
MTGLLYVVATPIGNLEDISARAIKVLSQVNRIAAEDTRHSSRLLQHLGINTPLVAVHDSFACRHGNLRTCIGYQCTT